MSILSSFTYHFFHAVWHVRAVILVLIVLVAVVLVFITPFAVPAG
jgi:hypothetical protein